MRRRRRGSGAAVATASVVAMALVVAILRARSPRATLRPAVPAASAPAPAGTIPATRCFGELVPALTLALAARPPAERAAAEIERKLATCAVPAAVRAELGGLARAAHALSGSGRDDDRALEDAVAGLDRALAAAGLGFYVDSELYGDGPTVLLFSFAVEGHTRYRGAGAEITALRLRRLDTLNFEHQALGLAGPTMPFAVVLLDAVDDRVLVVGPALAAGAGGGDPARREPPAIRARLGELARAELGGPGSAELGALLGRRAAFFAAVDRRLAARGAALDASATRRLVAPAGTPLAEVLTPAELATLAAIEAELERAPAAAALAALRERLVAAVERHEVQHRLDLLGPPIARPAGLGEHAAAELSAYTAELATSPTPGVSLGALYELAIDPTLADSADQRAVLELLGALAGTPLDPRRRAALDAAFIRLAAAPEALPAVAASAWQRWFGRPLPALVPRP